MENEKYSYIVENLEYYAKDKRHKDYLRLYMEEAAKAIRELTGQQKEPTEVQKEYIEVCKKVEADLVRMLKDTQALIECAVANVNWADVGTINNMAPRIREMQKELHRYVEYKIKDTMGECQNKEKED
ncbi:MAG: hypothetical protein IJG15_04925 [Lachnospiraceae bacterium]|nr:hypothetical protein [Lachnospiraceae bacterium]